MLWYKGWLETRWRLAMLAAILLTTTAFFGSQFTHNVAAYKRGADADALRLVFYYVEWPMLAMLLAGAGINTQTAAGTLHAIHPSMYFTLALPVTRRRLLTVRASVGALEALGLIVAGSLAGWAFTPPLRDYAGLPQMGAYIFTSAVGASVAYSVSVLLSTMVDEAWQVYLSGLSLVALWFVESRVLGVGPGPFGQVAWAQVAFCLVSSAALLGAALWKAERSQY